ncbi:MAG: disulfide bond formation protein B [Pseudomonadota bacterium]
MKFELTPRRVFAGLALIPLALLAEGLILQHLQGLAPCPPCILQREGFFLFALIALAAAIHNPRRGGAALYAGAMALAALAGLGVAILQVWALHHPKFGCGIDVMEQFVNNLPMAKLLPFIFHASGECSAPHDPILGLMVPEWSLAWFSVLFLAAVFFAFKWLMAAPARAAA